MRYVVIGGIMFAALYLWMLVCIRIIVEVAT